MKNVPKKIYLVIRDDEYYEDNTDFNDIVQDDGVSWCIDDINNDKLEYIALKDKQDWISVEDRLPEKRLIVATWSEDWGYAMAYIYQGKFEGSELTGKPTHWTTLPPPPN